MAANLIARYIWEVNALAKARHGLSLEELNEQWRDSYLYDDKDIVRKTWWEHRNQIGVQFGIDIEDDEVGYVALHIHSAIEDEKVSQAMQMARSVRECISMVEEAIGKPIDIASL